MRGKDNVALHAGKPIGVEGNPTHSIGDGEDE